MKTLEKMLKKNITPLKECLILRRHLLVQEVELAKDVLKWWEDSVEEFPGENFEIEIELCKKVFREEIDELNRFDALAKSIITA